MTLASLRGRPAAINFWASWCSPCHKEAPELEQVARQLRGRARLVGIDWTDGAGAARSYVRQYELTYPNLIDADGATGSKFGLNGLPTTFILDPQGRITDVLRGPQTADSLLRALHLSQLDEDEFLGNCHRALRGLPASRGKVSEPRHRARDAKRERP